MCTQKPPNDYSEHLYTKYKEAFVKYIKETVRGRSLCPVGCPSSLTLGLQACACAQLRRRHAKSTDRPHACVLPPLARVQCCSCRLISVAMQPAYHAAASANGSPCLFSGHSGSEAELVPAPSTRTSSLFRPLCAEAALTPHPLIPPQVLPVLKQHDAEVLLKELLTRWQNHKIMVRWLSRFFNYLDR